MDNFIFAEELELSIIDHRLENLFQMLDKLGVQLFYPSIVFNESFWQLSYEKKLSILVDKQIDWSGDHPNQRTVLYLDQFYIDLIKSIKVTYFNYTKLNLSSFLEIIKTKNKYSISDFQRFSDTNSALFTLLNNIILHKNDSYEASGEKKLLSKVEALKFYTRFFKSKKVNAIFFFYTFEKNYWTTFFDAIRKLDESQKTSLFKELNITFVFFNNYVYEQFQGRVGEIKYLQELLSNNQLKTEFVNITDIDELEFKTKYDYIFIDSVFSTFPTDIITKFNNTFYAVTSRLTYTDHSDPKEALEKIALLTSPINKIAEISDEDLYKISFEVSWELFDRPEITDLVDNARLIQERTIFRFSLFTLKLLVKLIKSLEKKGLIHIWDFTEDQKSKFAYGLFNDENGIGRILVDFDLYEKILDSFEDLSIKSITIPSNEVLSREILDGKEKFVRLKDVLDLINSDSAILQEFFDIGNFEFHDELKKITRKSKTLSSLREKQVFFFGVPTLLYRAGFSSFKKDLEKNEALKKIINPKEVQSFNLNSYDKEFLRNILPIIVDIFEQNKEVTLTRIRENPNNKNLIKVLEESHLKQDFFFEFINKYWERITEKSISLDSYKLMEIEID